MNSSSIPDQGFIDIHCHFLPGIDDGCKNVDESIECITMLKSIGYVGSICTPHVGIPHYPQNEKEFIIERTEQLQCELDAHSIDYKLWPGGEIRLPRNEGTSLISHKEIPRLAGSNVCLFDWWGKKWLKEFDHYFEQLMESGLQPVLAHPERLSLDDKAFVSLIGRLLKTGWLLQGNLKSFADDYDDRVQARAMKLLRANQYYIVASDSHGPRSIPSRIAGLNKLRELVSEQELVELMSTRPRGLV